MISQGWWTDERDRWHRAHLFQGTSRISRCGMKVRPPSTALGMAMIWTTCGLCKKLADDEAYRMLIVGPRVEVT